MATPGNETPLHRPLVLWDGECGLCRRSIVWLQRHDAHNRLAAIPYQEVSSPPLTPELRQACAEAVHVLRTDGSVLRGGRAMLFVLSQLGWRKTAAILSLPPLVWLVEMSYRLVARNRSLFSRLLFRGG